MLQYTGYARFNGPRHDHDGFGRDAADNDALFLKARFNCQPANTGSAP